LQALEFVYCKFYLRVVCMGNAAVYLLVSATALFWGANFVLAGVVLADMPPLWAAAVRFLLAAALMLAFAGVRREGLFGLLRRHAMVYLLFGTVGVAAFNLLFFYALQSTSATSGALIMAINPLLTTMLAAVFIGERASFRHLLALPVALAGVAVVISHGDMGRLASLTFSNGDLLMLVATLSWAAYNVLVRRYMPQGSPIAHTGWIMAAGAMVLLASALGSDSHIHALGFKASVAMAFMVIGGTVLAYLFWGLGIARLGAGRTAIFLNLVPVFAMLTGVCFDTLPSAAQLMGGLLVLGGVAITMLPARRLAVDAKS
jgi:drug/metabolite transporter (DMT)-like permease